MMSQMWHLFCQDVRYAATKRRRLRHPRGAFLSGPFLFCLTGLSRLTADQSSSPYISRVTERLSEAGKAVFPSRNVPIIEVYDAVLKLLRAPLSNTERRMCSDINIQKNEEVILFKLEQHICQHLLIKFSACNEIIIIGSKKPKVKDSILNVSIS